MWEAAGALLRPGLHLPKTKTQTQGEEGSFLSVVVKPLVHTGQSGGTATTRGYKLGFEPDKGREQ